MTKIKYLVSILFACTIITCAETKKDSSHVDGDTNLNPTTRVVLSSEIQWEQLNPARGDKSPQAGTIWGDRKGTVATGFLAKFVDGFSSPPHIHNVTYRAMVLKGLIHNDDPSAEKMWMPPGSFWTQPAGEAHITAAKGEEVIAYVEIDSGPYLVKPIEEAFDNGERPINIDKGNIMWLDASTTTMIEASQANQNTGVALLWKKEEMTGKLLKLPPSFSGKIISDGDIFYAIIILGEVVYKMPISKKLERLTPGSYFTATGKAQHQVHVEQDAETIIYIRTNGNIHIQ